jgi:tRNA(Ile)-lysidine synthase TilS/MesJ
MDTTDPDIRFNDNGICNHCTDFLLIRSHHNYKGAQTDQEFAELIQQIKRNGQGKKYDCVVGLSGGIDSSYAAFIAKREGLRVLGVHLDNGWNSEEAVLNIKNIARILGVDYESYVLDWEEFKEIQLAFLKASVPEADTPTDIAILSALHKVAAKYGVKHIISGGNFATEGILPKSWHYNAKDLTYFKHIHK